MVEVESSAPGLFSITASPKKKKAADIKFQSTHTDMSTSLHVRFFPN